VNSEQDVHHAFLNYLERVGRSRSTQNKYARVVGDLVESSGKPVATLGTVEIDMYLACWRDEFQRKHGRPPNPATYRNQVKALRAFYGWMERFDLLRHADGTLGSNPMLRIDMPRVEQRVNDWLRPAEDRALLTAPVPQHEHFIIALLRWTGLRASEAIALTVSDVDLTHGRETIVVRMSKTPAGRREIPVVPMLLGELRLRMEAIRAITVDGDARVLTTRNGQTIHSSYLWRVVKGACFTAGVRVVPCTCGTESAVHDASCPRTRSGGHVSRVSAHTLRRTFGSHLLNLGVRLEVVSRLLGHASTSVTERAYAELLHETARTELFQALGRAGYETARAG
jgi:integrase/recombinase XerD